MKSKEADLPPMLAAQSVTDSAGGFMEFDISGMLGPGTSPKATFRWGSMVRLSGPAARKENPLLLE
ncbi:MAG: hypothetical protein AMJ94_19860 [Deltaproteobacteria bacterium SM23_61]|nr:MAG: hypothetical protein AMJ94_19860 [Deltaproteobacteria bacterium SM23_61]